MYNIYFKLDEQNLHSWSIWSVPISLWCKQGLLFTRAVVHPELGLFLCSTLFFFWYQILNFIYDCLFLYFYKMNLLCLLHNLRTNQNSSSNNDMMAPFAGITS